MIFFNKALKSVIKNQSTLFSLCTILPSLLIYFCLFMLLSLSFCSQIPLAVVTNSRYPHCFSMQCFLIFIMKLYTSCFMFLFIRSGGYHLTNMVNRYIFSPNYSYFKSLKVVKGHSMSKEGNKKQLFSVK